MVRGIPRGKVLTYGQLAELAGFPGQARLAGASLRESRGLPWQRVVGRAGPTRGKIALFDASSAALQRRRLAAEGVQVSAAGTIDLVRFGWLALDLPVPAGPRSRAAPRVRGPRRGRRAR
ncbi:MAG: MGMT family protein [Kofleriaceae bacterium]